MRTRRSWRNQDRLFKALFKPADQPIAVAPILTDAAIDAMYWIPKTSRSLMKRDAAKRRTTESAIAPRHEIEWVIRSCLDENLMQLWAHKAKVEKIKAWLQSPPSVYEYVCDCGVRVTPHRCQIGTEF